MKANRMMMKNTILEVNCRKTSWTCFCTLLYPAFFSVLFIIFILSVKVQFHQCVYADACNAEYKCFKQCIKATEINEYYVDHIAAGSQNRDMFDVGFTDGLERECRECREADQDDKYGDTRGYDEVCELETHAFFVSALLRQVVETHQEK